MEKLRSKKIPNRDLINKFGERLKNGEKIEDIYGELVNKEYYRRTISGREAWLSYALRNLAFACLENKVEFFEKKGLDLLKYVTSYAIEELLIYPLIHYLRDYLDKSPDESLTIDGHTFTKEGLLTTTVNGFINSELRRKYHMKFEEDYDVSDPSCKEKYPIFYIGVSFLHMLHFVWVNCFKKQIFQKNILNFQEKLLLILSTI